MKLLLELNKIYNMDCVKGIKLLDDNSIDLVITSPPYNVNLGESKHNRFSYDLYNDNREYKQYIEWLKTVFNGIYRVLKSGGRVCVNIGDGKNGAVSTSSDIIQFMTRELNYIQMTHIIWNKNQTRNRAAWGSFNSPSSPSFPRPFEHILVFAKENKKLQYKGETDLSKEDFINWSFGLWTFAPETNQKKFGHPAMFPEELPKRCMKMFSWVGAAVLDPFMGSGTTAKAALLYNRNFIGFEISDQYCDIAKKRLSLIKNYPSAIVKPRTGFS